MRTDWTPYDAPLGDNPTHPPQLAADIRHVAGCRHNGLPVPVPYLWRRGDAERDAQIAAALAAIRARLAARRSP